MEYIIVSFTGKTRSVLRNGQPVGNTNVKLSMNAGNYTFSLAPPMDFTPPSQDAELINTSVASPMTIAFAALTVAASAPGELVSDVLAASPKSKKSATRRGKAPVKAVQKPKKKKK